MKTETLKVGTSQLQCSPVRTWSPGLPGCWSNIYHSSMYLSVTSSLRLLERSLQQPRITQQETETFSSKILSFMFLLGWSYSQITKESESLLQEVKILLVL